MARPDLDDGFGNAIDKKTVLIDRRKNPDRNAPALRRRRAGIGAGEAAKSRLDQRGHPGKAIALRGRHDAVVMASKQRAAQ